MNQMFEFFIFRHGETDWNCQRRFQGHTDIALNAKGENQARELPQLVKSLGIQVVLSSDLSRAHQTAAIAFKDLQVPITTHRELREAFFGDPEGQLIDDVIEKYGQKSWARWCSPKEEDLDFSYPNSESKRGQLDRVRTFLEEFCGKSKFNRVAISTHGGVVRRMVHSSDNSPQLPITLPNCGVHKLTFSGLQWSYAGVVQF